MALQANASILEQRSLGDKGRVMLCKNTDNGDRVWTVYSARRNEYLPFPFRAFSNITDFHDFVKYDHQTITMRKK